MSRLSDHALEQHLAAILALLDQYGEATLEDIRDQGVPDEERVVRATVNAPLDPPHQLALFEYTEIYRRLPDRTWELTYYSYEFQQRPGPGRRAHHWHDDRHHAHCVDPRHPERDHHYRGVPVSVYEAHSDFAPWYGSARPIDCTGLFPL